MEWDIVITAIAGLVAAIVGAVVGAVGGWWLSERSTREREKRSDEKIGRSVRVLLSLEIDRNIRHLRDYWEGANNLANPSEHERSNDLQLARRLTLIAVPIWSREAWTSQLPHVTTALHDDEILAAHNIYRHLDEFAAYGTMLTQLAEQEAQHFEPGTIIPLGGSPVVSHAPTLVEKMRGLYTEVLTMGNPLKPRLHR